MNLNWLVLNYVPKNVIELIWKSYSYITKKSSNRLLYLLHTKDIFTYTKELFQKRDKKSNKYYQITIEDCFNIANYCSDISLAISHNVYLYFLNHLKLCKLHDIEKHLNTDSEKYYCNLFFSDDINKITADTLGLNTVKYVTTYLLNKSYTSLLNISMDMYRNKDNKKEYVKLYQYQLELKQHYNRLLSILNQY